MSQAPPRSRKTHGMAITLAPRGVQVAEAVYLCGSQKADVHATLLEQAHHIEHGAGLRRAPKVWGIGHGVKQLRRGRFADDAVSNNPIALVGMGAFRHGKGNQRQPHADEDNLRVANFPGRRSHHKLAGRVCKSRHRAGDSSAPQIAGRLREQY